MTDFSSGAMGSGYNFFIDNDSASYSGSQSNKDQVFGALAAAFPHFTQGSHIGIISCFYLKSSHFFQFFFNILSPPMKIYRTGNLTAFFHRAGNADADTFYLRFIQFLLLDLCQNSLCYIRKDLLSFIFHMGPDFPFIYRCPVVRKQSAFNRSSSYIDTKTIFFQCYSSPSSLFLAMFS